MVLVVESWSSQYSLLPNLLAGETSKEPLVLLALGRACCSGSSKHSLWRIGVIDFGQRSCLGRGGSISKKEKRGIIVRSDSLRLRSRNHRLRELFVLPSGHRSLSRCTREIRLLSITPKHPCCLDLENCWDRCLMSKRID